LIGDQPSSDKVVVVRIKLKFAPPLSLKAIEEQGTLQDFRPEGARAPGHARCATIDTVSRRDFEIPSLNVCPTQPIEASGQKRSRSYPLDTLAGANATNLEVLERCQKPGKDCFGPRDIVVCHDDERRLDLGNSFTDLNPLIRNGNLENSDVRDFQGLHKASKFLIFVHSCDQQKLVGLACQNALQ
jgi:hypothetical protein